MKTAHQTCTSISTDTEAEQGVIEILTTKMMHDVSFTGLLRKLWEVDFYKWSGKVTFSLPKL